jgi:hypothetical protein
MLQRGASVKATTKSSLAPVSTEQRAKNRSITTVEYLEI